MKAIILTAISLLSITNNAKIISEYQSFNSIAPENFTGKQFSLNSAGKCELVKRKATRKYKAAKVVSREVVALSNCKMELIAKEVRSKVNLCHASKDIIESDRDGNEDTTFLKRGHDLILSHKLTIDCLCIKSIQKRRWSSNSENIFLHPLNSLFNGPTTKGYTKLEDLDYYSCSALALTKNEQQAIQDAYRAVEDRLINSTK